VCELIRGDSILAKAAAKAARNWNFKPFIKNGEPTAVSGNLPFDFEIPENGPDPRRAAQQVGLPPGVGAGRLIDKVSPVYPDEARRTPLQATLLLQAQISKDRSVKKVRSPTCV
jgi:hypothetical protein